jgi:hypothetical protein
LATNLTQRGQPAGAGYASDHDRLPHLQLDIDSALKGGRVWGAAGAHGRCWLQSTSYSRSRISIVCSSVNPCSLMARHVRCTCAVQAERVANRDALGFGADRQTSGPGTRARIDRPVALERGRGATDQWPWNEGAERQTSGPGTRARIDRPVALERGATRKLARRACSPGCGLSLVFEGGTEVKWTSLFDFR